MKRHGIGQGALLLDDARAGIDEILAGLGRKRGYHASIVGTAGVGNKAVAEVNNPSANTKTAYGLLGDLWVATAMTVLFTYGGTTLAPATAPIPAYAGGPASAVVVGGGNQAAPTGTSFLGTPSLTANLQYALPGWFWFALPPGQFLQAQGGTVNQAFTFNAYWIELST
jgi:hypothetical protein